MMLHPIAFAIAFALPSSLASAADLPARVGECVETRISSITSDFPGAPGGGSVIHYENGGQQLSFDKIPGLDTTAIGDPVRVCLVQMAEGCAPGDSRGRTYEGTNLRSGLTWRASDTLMHNCSGA
jgi:hypothetical protein